MINGTKVENGLWGLNKFINANAKMKMENMQNYENTHAISCAGHNLTFATYSTM